LVVILELEPTGVRLRDRAVRDNGPYLGLHRDEAVLGVVGVIPTAAGEQAVTIQLDDRLSAYGLGSFVAPLLAMTGVWNFFG